MWSISRDGRLDRLVVFKFLGDGYVPAGEIRVEGGGHRRVSRFSYAQSYLKRRTGRSIDTINLPLNARWTASHPEEVSPAFHDSGPDGWGKGVLDAAFPTLRLGMPEYLALGSLRRTGDLAYGPTPDGPETWCPEVRPLIDLPSDGDDLDALVAAAETLDQGEATQAHLALLLRTSADVGGARPKARISHRGCDWIAKFPTWSDTFDEPKMEAVCLDIAAAAGIETPDHEVITIRNRSVLLVKRFDRDSAGRPLGYLSAGTLLGEPTSGYGTTRTYTDIAEVGRRIGAPETAEQMFRRFLVNSSLRNTDDHLRNHAFIQEDGGWRLSPVFDIVPNLRGGRHVCAPGPALSPEWNPASAFAAHEPLGLRQEQAAAIQDEVARAMEQLDDLMDRRKVDPADRLRIRTALGSRERQA